MNKNVTISKQFHNNKSSNNIFIPIFSSLDVEIKDDPRVWQSGSGDSNQDMKSSPPSSKGIFRTYLVKKIHSLIPFSERNI
jgi:hypothetical protein